VKPKLLLHICCGPCAAGAILRLQQEYELVGFFSNSNIHPEAEYWRRLAAVQQLAAAWHLLVDVDEYDHGAFLERARGLEQEPEGGERCAACFRLRLERANGCSLVASTLTIGRNKRAEVIDPIGREVCRAAGVEFLAGDWKKRDGQRASVECARELGLYRQDYCGCEFSRRDRGD
jgi:hypothetical protein